MAAAFTSFSARFSHASRKSIQLPEEEEGWQEEGERGRRGEGEGGEGRKRERGGERGVREGRRLKSRSNPTSSSSMCEM